MSACARFRESGKAEVASVEVAGVPVVLVKPLTFMNLSGQAVAPLLRKHGGEVGDLIVVHDDLDIAAGLVKLKRGGGAAGHNGLRSLIADLGSAEFVRVRIGVGRPPPGVDGADYVLSRPPPDIGAAVSRGAEDAATAVRDLFTEGVDKAMTRWNARKAGAPA